jgi:DNA repair photolyase
MQIKEIQAKSLLRKYKKIDSWFISRYGMNPYRGCLHNCAYCDGRAEKYQVEGEFGKEISVKTNAVQLLEKELSPKGKRIPLKKAFVLPGGGVGDLYQAVEKEYEIGRKILQIIFKYNFPLHILTKSVLVERDLSLIKKINEKSGAIVSSSFSSIDKSLGNIFEPGVPAPERRLEMLAKFKQNGIGAGMFLLPVIPFITDSEKMIETAFAKAKEFDLDYVIYGGMTLKPGIQKKYFFDLINGTLPNKLSSIFRIYSDDNPYGQAHYSYYKKIENTFVKVSQKNKIQTRIPLTYFQNILDINDLTVVLFEHIHHYLKAKGEKSSFAYAAFQLSKVKSPLLELYDKLSVIKGMGKEQIEAARQIIDTRSCDLYESLIS